MPHSPASIEELRDHLLAGRAAVYRHWAITLVDHPEDPSVKIPTYWEDQDGFHVKDEHLKHIRVDYEVPGTHTKKFYEHIITVRVLADRDIGEISGPNSAADVLQQCDEGDFVGELVQHTSREVSAMCMAELLVSAGSEPGFFQLSDAQTLASEIHESASTEGCDPDLVVVSRQAYNELMRSTGLCDYELKAPEGDAGSIAPEGAAVGTTPEARRCYRTRGGKLAYVARVSTAESRAEGFVCSEQPEPTQWNLEGRDEATRGEYDLAEKVAGGVTPKVGGRYATRAGDVVEISSVMHDENSVFPVTGVLRNRSGQLSAATWTLAGTFATHTASDHDLVAELPSLTSPAASETNEELKLEAGKRYMTRDGRITDGLVVHDQTASFPFAAHVGVFSRTWDSSGRFGVGDHPLDLVAEYKEDAP